MTKQQEILCCLLNCGIDDLHLLKDINYDLDDILDYLMEIHDLSINSIFREVFKEGARDLKYAFESSKDDIDIWIKDEIEFWRKEAKLECISDNPTDDEIDEVLKNDKEYQALLSDLELLKSENLNPIEGLEYYTNYLDTHVFMENIDFYKNWIPNKVEKIENWMGWEFERY